ncbi:GTPase [Longibacter salinarum]|uniref:GTPase n=1 Tax=Longibacter salinarum TaxID=1850348 RepID=A0A2A8CUI0_9BACT|nr:GTP-binding protein [Longibacter salinarum]PEN11413.1 GTPase [Longibacter salinarum]
MSDLKIVVTGPFHAGKTTFVRSLAREQTVSTEEATTLSVAKEHTTVGLDFGCTRVGRHSVKLFGTPGQKRFAYMWDVLSTGADGIILLIPADRHDALVQSLTITKHLGKKEKRPLAVGITRMDLADNDPFDRISRTLGKMTLSIDHIDARDVDQCMSLVRALAHHIDP